MKILLLTHSYPDGKNTWRGSFVRAQAEALSNLHNVTVVSFRNDIGTYSIIPKLSSKKTVSGNLILYSITITRSLPVLNQFFFLQKCYHFILKVVLADYHPEIIHCHLAFPAGFLGTFIGRRLKLPVVITEHSRIKNYFRSSLHKIFISYALRKSDSVIAVSNSLKKEIETAYSRKVKVIPNIVETGKFSFIKRKSGKSLNIGFLGGLNDRNKGLDILLKASLLLIEKNFSFSIGGDGILADQYKIMARDLGISERCKFHGNIQRDGIAAFYSDIDIFVLPSRYETFGVVLIEAMACGIPVVATRCGGPEDIITPETGILIEIDNPEALAGAIIKISESPNTFNSVVIRKYVADNFSEGIFVEKVTNLYKELISLKTNG